MSKTNQRGAKDADALQKTVKSLSAQVERLEERMGKHDRALRSLSNGVDGSAERVELLMEALSLDGKSKKGDRGFLNELSESILHLDEYLLRNSERIDTILVTLKNHRELLMKMNDAYFMAGEKERIRLELDVMKNTISIMALAGIDTDVSLLREIRAVQATLKSTDVNISELRKTKEKLDKRFDGEMKRFDVESIYLKRKDIPGYG